MSADRPRIRAYLQPVPVEVPELADAGPLFLLRDPFRIATPMPFTAAALAVMSLLDGTRTPAEVQAEFAARHGVAPPTEDLDLLLRQLEEGCLLEGPRLERELSDFAHAAVRPAACLGSYPEDPEELRRFLEAQYTRAGGPGAGPGEPRDRRAVRGVVSPHIDPLRGGHTYAWAWRAVAESCPARLFVIFGTSHTGTGAPLGGDDRPAPRYALTRKRFATPLGEVPTDEALLDRLLAAYDGPDDLLAGEAHHRGEHSIEFQVVHLAHLFAGTRPLRILPILCGGLDDVDRPSQDERLGAFHRALRAALAPLPLDEVAFVAGVDLAHVGAQFDEPPVDARAVAEVEQLDRATLRLVVEERCPDALHADIVRDHDRRNICGHAALVGFLEALRDPRAPVEGELLHYDRWHDGRSAVSFASAVFRRREAGEGT